MISASARQKFLFRHPDNPADSERYRELRSPSYSRHSYGRPPLEFRHRLMPQDDIFVAPVFGQRKECAEARQAVMARARAPQKP
ncbi:toxin YdaT domain-containing protein [Klebsiella variicola subsp. variicola]|nr:toxin YdaT domain-containing protein [Klebsiella variicola subsp. variicola]